MNSFNEVLNYVLKAFENNPNASVEELISSITKELGVSAEGVEKLNQVLSTLDAFEEKSQKLQKAKAEGDTREGWIQEELHGIASKIDLEESQKQSIINNLVDSIQKSFNSI